MEGGVEGGGGEEWREEGVRRGEEGVRRRRGWGGEGG